MIKHYKILMLGFMSSFRWLTGCSKRPSSKAAGSGATEAYPRGYVAGRHTTENDAGGLFQQPLRLNGNVDIGRHTIRPLLIRHPQLKPVGPFL